MSKEFILFLCMGLFNFCDAQKKVVVGSMEEIIYPIDTTDLATFEDLAPFKEILASRKVIGLGEATHGTQEFCQIKVRLFKFLVRQCGFRSLILEAPFGSMLFINDYISTGQGDPDTLMRKTGYWIFYNPWIRSLIEWAKAYNNGKKESEKISFYGMDMQTPADALDYIAAKLDPYDLNGKQAFLDIIRPAVTHPKLPANPKKTVSDEKIYDSLLQSVPLLESWLESNRRELLDLLPEKTLTLFRLCIRNFGYAIRGQRSDMYFRDSCMANNVREIVSLHDKSTVVWAHNGHIGMFDPLVNYESLRKPLGEHLQQIFKELYYPVGFFFHEGSFLALEKKKRGRTFYYPNLRVFHLPPAPSVSLTGLLLRASEDPFFLDISRSANGLWKSYHKAYNLGATYTAKGNNIIYVTPGQVFKGLVFVKNSTAVNQIDDFFYRVKE